MYQFLSGGMMVGCFVVGLFFFRFWRRTRDRLFAIFALSFWLMALERIPLAILNSTSEDRVYVYTVRLLAYALIIYAVIDKNRHKNVASPPE